MSEPTDSVPVSQEEHFPSGEVVEPVMEEVVDVPADEPVVDEPVVDEPVVDEPVVEEPVVDEPVVDEPVVDEPVVEEPVVDEPVVEEPVVDEPVVEEPVADEPVADEPVADEPVADEPVADEPVVEEVVATPAEEPAVDQPVVEQTVVEEVPPPPPGPIPVPVEEPVVAVPAEEPPAPVEETPVPVEEVTVTVNVEYTTILVKPTKVTMDSYNPQQQKLINALNAAVTKGESEETKIPPEIIAMFTWAGLKTKRFLNALLEMDDARYLEISPWEGSSIFSTLAGNKANVTMMYPSNGNEASISDYLPTYKGNNNVNLIVNDYFSYDVKTLPKFNIFMYDADWSEDAQYQALKQYYDNMDNTFIYIADDWNWHSVQKGTIRAIQDLNLTILEEFECLLTPDGSHTGMELAKSDWWNGIYVAVLQKN